MRVLYLGSTDLPQPKARAIQIVHTCHALARAGVDVTLVAGRRGRIGPAGTLRGYGLEPHPRLCLVRVPIARIPPTAPPRVLAWFTRVWQASYLAGLLAVLPRELSTRRPDVVFVRDLRTARLAAGLAHAVGARLLVEVHGLPSYEVEQGAARATLPSSECGRLRALEQDVFDRAHCIVTITEAARRLVIDSYGVLPARVSTVPDGTRVSPVALRPEMTSSSDDRPAVYYVGQLYPWKGAGLVVDVAARVPEARFVVVGGMPNGDRGDPDVDALVERARQAGAANVELRGYLPYARVADELRSARVALLPLPDEPVARYFTSPLKLFDYMAAGVPIVASDLPAIREVLRHGENALLARPDDPAAFADAVRRLVAAPDLAQRLGRQARVDVERYSWDARAAALLDVIAGTPARSVA
jgi:glycosyltransferase involved in cell wall biosynthesis